MNNENYYFKKLERREKQFLKDLGTLPKYVPFKLKDKTFTVKKIVKRDEVEVFEFYVKKVVL